MEIIEIPDMHSRERREGHITPTSIMMNSTNGKNNSRDSQEEEAPRSPRDTTFPNRSREFDQEDGSPTPQKSNNASNSSRDTGGRSSRYEREGTTGEEEDTHHEENPHEDSSYNYGDNDDTRESAGTSGYSAGYQRYDTSGNPQDDQESPHEEEGRSHPGDQRRRESKRPNHDDSGSRQDSEGDAEGEGHTPPNPRNNQRTGGHRAPHKKHLLFAEPIRTEQEIEELYRKRQLETSTLVRKYAEQIVETDRRREGIMSQQ